MGSGGGFASVDEQMNLLKRGSVDLVDEEVAWFSEMGSLPLELELAVTPVGDGS